MKKSLLVLAALSLLVVACQNPKPEFKIGFVGPLSGQNADSGRKISQAVSLAIDNYNAGKDPGISVSLVKEDSAGDPGKAAAAVDTLITTYKIMGLIGEVSSASSLAIEPKIDAAKLVEISPAAADADLIGKTPFFFRTIADANSQADVLARYVALVAKAKTAAILYTKNPKDSYSESLAQDFQKAFEAQGGKIVASESAQQGDKEYKAQLGKINSANPEVLFLPDYVADIAQILPQAVDLGLKAHIVASDSFGNPEALKISGAFAEGVIFSAFPDPTSDTSSQFESAYKAKFGEEPDEFAKNAYDATNILINAIFQVYKRASDDEKKSGNLNRDSVRAATAATRSFDGVSGTITFAQDGSLIKNWAIKTVVKDGDGLKFQQNGIYKVENNIFLQIQ